LLLFPVDADATLDEDPLFAANNTAIKPQNTKNKKKTHQIASNDKQKQRRPE